MKFSHVECKISTQGNWLSPLATLGPRQSAEVAGRMHVPLWTFVTPHICHTGRAKAQKYAVTFRLADSLPKHVLEGWLFERENLIKTAAQMKRPLSEYEEKRLCELHSERIERYLDAGRGECLLARDEIAEMVMNALLFFDGQRYELYAWCVMPNHVHIVMQPLGEHSLPNILHSWKSLTAKEAGKLIKRTGEFWQAEYCDHLIRDADDFAHASITCSAILKPRD